MLEHSLEATEDEVDGEKVEEDIDNNCFADDK
jgi:hypothetical protein